MFILSQAIIPVFVFAVLVNFYNFDPIFSKEVSENFTCCDDCMNSTCYQSNNGTCTLSSDNITAQCFTCSDENGDKQFTLEEDCEQQCKQPNTCVCDGMCYKCTSNTNTNDQPACVVPTINCDAESNNPSASPPATPPGTPATPATPPATPPATTPATPATPAAPSTPSTPSTPATPATPATPPHVYSTV